MSSTLPTHLRSLPVLFACGEFDSVCTFSSRLRELKRYQNSPHCWTRCVRVLRFASIPKVYHEWLQPAPSAGSTTRFSSSGVIVAAGRGRSRIRLGRTSTRNAPIELRDLDSNQVFWKLDGHSHSVLSLREVLPSDWQSHPRLVSGDDMGSIIVHDFEHGEELIQFEMAPMRCCVLEGGYRNWNVDEVIVAGEGTSKAERALCWYNVDRGQVLARVKTPHPIVSLAPDLDNRRFFSCWHQDSFSGRALRSGATIKCWDNLTHRSVINLRVMKWPRCVCFASSLSSSGGGGGGTHPMLLVGGDEGFIEFWDVRQSRKRVRLLHLPSTTNPVRLIKSLSNQLFVAVVGQSQLQLFDSMGVVRLTKQDLDGRCQDLDVFRGSFSFESSVLSIEDMDALMRQEFVPTFVLRTRMRFLDGSKMELPVLVATVRV